MAALLEREQYIERRPLTRGYIMPIIGPAHRQPAVLPKHFKTFARAGFVTYEDRCRPKSFQHGRK